jgi:hypothetical protein
MSFDDAIGLQHGAADPRLIDAMVAARRRSKPHAYRLWYLGGLFGFHNFYLGKSVLGALQACAIPFCVAAIQTAKAMGTDTTGGRTIWLIGIAALVALGVSLLIDVLLIPVRVEAHSERLRAQFEAEADWRAA